MVNKKFYFKNRKVGRFLSLGVVLVALVATAFTFPNILESANLTSSKDTLETSRLSFHGKNAVTLTTGTTVIQMATSGTPSISTANLFAGDTIIYTTSSNSYTVDQIIDADEFSITAALAAIDADANDEFVVDRTAQHTISFTTASAVPNGAIRIRIPAAAANFNDGDPDQTGFDFNSLVGGDISCPTDTSEFDFVAGTATVSGGTNCSSTSHHCVECRYSGSGLTGQALSLTIGSTNEFLNPSAASGHSAGTADTYGVIIDNLDANDAVIDSTTVKIAVIESVRVTATVDPTISFATAAVGVGTTACGNALDVATTATTVPFGSLSISAFTDLAQQLTVSTNAQAGYVVTAIEDNQLSIGGDHSVEMADTPGDNTSASHTASDEWSSTATKGFGFSLENIDANSVAFSYDTATGNCTGTYCSRQFADLANSESPQTIFSSSTTADSEDVYVCFRSIVSSTQQAGDYANQVTYRATATF